MRTRIRWPVSPVITAVAVNNNRGGGRYHLVVPFRPAASRIKHLPPIFVGISDRIVFRSHGHDPGEPLPADCVRMLRRRAVTCSDVKAPPDDDNQRRRGPCSCMTVAVHVKLSFGGGVGSSDRVL